MHLSQPLSDKNYMYCMQSAGTKNPLTLMTTSQLPRLPLQIKYKSNTTTFSLFILAILLRNAQKIKTYSNVWTSDEKLATYLLGMSKNLEMKFHECLKRDDRWVVELNTELYWMRRTKTGTLKVFEHDSNEMKWQPARSSALTLTLQKNVKTILWRKNL